MRGLLSNSTSAALAAVLLAAPAGAQTLARGPYLQQVGEHSALIVWRTTTALACTLSYGPPSAGHWIATPPGSEHVATLTGLEPETLYEYGIRAAGRQLAGGGDFHLRTAPLPGTNAAVRLLVWGDSGTGDSQQMQVAAVLDTQSADLALHVGDIVYPSGAASDYDPHYFSPYAPLLRHTPVWAVPGNHDAITIQAFLDAWYLPTNPVDGSERFYSFDYGDIHFTALDTNQPLSSGVLAWLENDLRSTSRLWKLVFFHHTMYSCGSYHGSTSALISTLGPIFDAGGVDLVLYGHDHHYERSFALRAGQVADRGTNGDFVQPPGTIYVISGGGATPRATGTSCWWTARAMSVSHFLRLEVQGGRLVLAAVGTSGQVLDRMTITKSGEPPPPPEVIDLLAPAGGESLEIGTPFEIRWTASPSLGPLRIQMSRSGNAGPWETLFASTPNDGSEMWTASCPTSDACLLRLASADDGTPSDDTAATFRLVPRRVAGSAGAGETTLAGLSGGTVRINFQPVAAPVPEGYGADSGQIFDLQRGYGWTSTVAMRERGMLPGDPRDTFADVVNNTAPAVWEMAVGNGSYSVSITCGDPYTSATHRVAIEGEVVVQDAYTIGGQFVERRDLPVTVNDGRLTIAAGGSGAITHTKVNAIQITPVGGSAGRFLAPAGGESYCLGTPQSLCWTGEDPSRAVRLQLSRHGADGPWETLYDPTPDDGEETWVPSGAASGSCLLRLCSTSGEPLVTSASAFALVAPAIDLLRPRGGETWTAGRVESFEWQSNCVAGGVLIELSQAGPAGPWTPILARTANDGREAWTVRAEDVGQVYARISVLEAGGPADTSTASFTIAPAPPPPPGWRIDFQPAGAITPTGWLADTGLPYSPSRGYGWNTTMWTRQRDMLPGDCRDTFVQVVNTGTATWNLDVPVGDYLVSLVCGDPYTSGTHRVAIEGRLVVEDVYAIGGAFVSRDNVRTSVVDGQLTVTVGGSGQITSSKLACLEVTPLALTGTDPRPDPQATGDRPSLETSDQPVRGTTTVGVRLTRAGHVRLAVHDVLGRRVACVYEGFLAAGRHDLAWRPVDARGARLASGVYFLRLEGDDLLLRRKAVVVR